MAALTEADMVQILREQGVEVGKSSYLYIRTFVHTDAHKCTHMHEQTPNKQQPSSMQERELPEAKAVRAMNLRPRSVQG